MTDRPRPGDNARPTGAERWRQVARQAKSSPVRALYQWPLACLATAVVGAALDLLFPNSGDVIGAVLSVGLFAFLAYGVVGSFAQSGSRITRWVRAHRLGVLFYSAMTALAILLRWLRPPLQDAGMAVLGVGSMLGCLVFAARAFRQAAAAKRGTPLPPSAAAPPPNAVAAPSVLASPRIVVDDVISAARDTIAAVREMFLQPAAAVSPVVPIAAPFGETADAQAARLEELHAWNAMLRAIRQNGQPMQAFASADLFIIGPISMVGMAVLGAAMGTADLLRGKLVPKDVGGIAGSLLVGLAGLALYRLVVTPHRLLGDRVVALARHFGATTIAGYGPTMLDWLDRFWADWAPISGLGTLGWHWVVAFERAERPALLSVIDDLGVRGSPRTRRIDLYLPEPLSAPKLDESAVARALALGYDVVQSPAGVRFERRDNELAALTPAVLDELLAISAALAASR